MKTTAAIVTGPTQPEIGKIKVYEADFQGRNVIPSNIKWKVFKKKYGKWVEVKGLNPKVGKKVNIKFTQVAYLRSLLVVAYSSESELKSPSGLVILPIMGERKIKKTEVLDVNGEKLSKPLKYGQSIILKVTTENMVDESLKLSFWEKNTLSSKGHNPDGNTQLWSGRSKAINRKGIIEEKIAISLALKTGANKGLLDDSEYECYLLVEADKRVTFPARKYPKPEPAILEQVPVKIKNKLGVDKVKGDEGNKLVTVDMPDDSESKSEEHTIEKEKISFALLGRR